MQELQELEISKEELQDFIVLKQTHSSKLSIKDFDDHTQQIDCSTVVDQEHMNKKIKLLCNIKQQFQCKLCQRCFTENGSLKKHILSVHEGKKRKKSFECKICDAKFSSTPSLNNHILSFHERKKPFKCSICKIKFVTK